MTLEGSLRDISFADLFEIFHASHHSGRLRVSRSAEHGLIFVGDGQILDAVLVTDLEGASAAYAEDALNRILSWHDADFTFAYDLSVKQRPCRIKRDIDWILACAMRAATPPISLDSLLRPAMPAANTSGPLTFTVEEWRLFNALWPQRTLGMACAELDLAAHEALQIARSLIERGLLTAHSDEETRRTVTHTPKLAQPSIAAPPLRHSVRPQPAAAAAAAATSKSLLLKAIIRRVRML
jgi:hypothetical protein